MAKASEQYFIWDDQIGKEKRLYTTGGKMPPSEWDEKSPLAKLLASRKFLLMLLDVVLALGLYFGTKYLNPSAVDDIKQVILLLQPVIVTLILAIAHEDAATTKVKAAELQLEQARLEAGK